MKLYLLRHGAAEARSAPGGDASRRLTVEGAAAVRRTMDRVAAMGVRPALILSSPLLRAIETAEIAARAFAYQGAILRSAALASESSPEDLWDEVRACGQDSVLAVTHEPLVSRALAWLQGVSEEQPFSPGAIACVDIEQARAVPLGKLRWLVD